MQFSAEEREKLKKFTQDPDWAIIQKAVGEKIVTLALLNQIDDTKPSEDVKAQVRGAKLARNILLGFFQACDMISKDISEPSVQDSERDFN